MNAKQIQKALENYRQENHMELATMPFGDIIDACSQHLKECAIVAGEKQYIEADNVESGPTSQVFTIEVQWRPDCTIEDLGKPTMLESDLAVQRYIRDSVGDGNYEIVQSRLYKATSSRGPLEEDLS